MEVSIKLSKGKIRQQSVIDEQLPKFCSSCDVLRHTTISCKGKGVSQDDYPNNQPSKQQAKKNSAKEGKWLLNSLELLIQGSSRKGLQRLIQSKKVQQEGGIVKGIQSRQNATGKLTKETDSVGNGGQFSRQIAALNQHCSEQQIKRNSGQIQSGSTSASTPNAAL